MQERFQFNRIGIVHSPFRQKFGIPRQPGLCPSVTGKIELVEPYNHPDSVRGLDGFSHIWVLFVFHAITPGKWTPLVRPPRLGGNERMGVYATRSTHRPNPIGQSVVKLENIAFDTGRPVLSISGHDLLDQTPVLDIKPYVPYADAQNNVRDGFISRTVFTPLKVKFSDTANTTCDEYTQDLPLFRQMLIEILQQDPRPAYHKQDPERRDYGIQLYELNIRYCLEDDTITVLEIAPL